jgi:hypothetical protein
MRNNTCRVLEMVDAGELDVRVVLEAALGWIPDYEVRQLMEVNELWMEDEE